MALQSTSVTTPSLTIDRADQGIAKFTYIGTDGVKYIKNGCWDDATPFASGTYAMSFSVFHSSSNAFLLADVPSRSGIEIHNGSSTNHSEGCFVVEQAFIDLISKDLNRPGITSNDKTIPVTVNEEYNDLRLKLSADKTTVSEGDSIQLKLELVGRDSGNGISKDVYVKIKTAGSAEKGVDYSDIVTLPESYTLDSVPGYIKIPKGQQSVTITIPTTSDNDDSGSENPSETALFKIADYVIMRTSNGLDKPYTDEANILLSSIQGLDIREEIKIENKSSIVNTTVNASGGYEGYHNTAQFAPGQTLSVFFQPYTIPDEMIITSSDGTTLLDTGFVGGYSVSDVVTIPSDSDGKVDIKVLTNDTGTAWTFTVSNQNGSSSQTTLKSMINTEVREAHELIVVDSQSLPSDHNNSLLFAKNSDSSLEGDDSTVGAFFSVILNDISYRGKTIEWTFSPVSGSSASADDFDSGSVLSGSFNIDGDASLGDNIIFYELPEPKQDNISEGLENFKIIFTDALTHQPILDANSQPVELLYSIVDEYTVTPVITGEDGSDYIDATVGSDVIVSGLGEDYINAKEGNDFICSGPGNDSIFAGDGNDKIWPDFGEDIIDGGNGFDTVYINRPKADIEISHINDNEMVLIDLSGVPLGQKTLKSVEHIVFSDGEFPELPNLVMSVDRQVANLQENYKYTLTVSNIGKGDATGVALTEVCDSSINFVSSSLATTVSSGNTLVTNIGNLTAGESVSFDITANAIVSGNLGSYFALTLDQQDSNPDDNYQQSVQFIDTVFPEPVDLSVTQILSDESPKLNDLVTLNITVQNSGQGLATDVQIHSSLEGLTVVSASSEHGIYDIETGIWSVDSINDNLPETLTLTLLVDSPGRRQVTTEIISVQESDVDSIPGNSDRNEDDYSSMELRVATLDLRDFNGDGTTDLLLEDGVTTRISLIHNGQIMDSNLVGYNLNPAGTGDFNGDGTTDLLLEDGVTTRISLIHDGQIMDSNLVGYNLNPAGTGDFNGDGTTDLLLEDGVTTRISLIHDGQIMDSKFIGYNLNPVGTGDFNGDGTTDLLLKDGAMTMIALIHNGQIMDSKFIGYNLNPVGTGDFNGDGTTDLLMENGCITQVAMIHDGLIAYNQNLGMLNIHGINDLMN